jgi:hypothetical protein
MATGSDTYKGLAVPLFGDFQIKQRTAATDIMTITGASGQSGDFIVCENSSGTELFYVDSSGNIVSAGTSLTLATGSKIAFGALVTTAPTPAAAGDFFVVQDSTGVQIAIANSSADLMYSALFTTTAIS